VAPTNAAAYSNTVRVTDCRQSTTILLNRERNGTILYSTCFRGSGFALLPNPFAVLEYAISVMQPFTSSTGFTHTTVAVNFASVRARMRLNSGVFSCA
jgi:hypothetical protein